MTTQATPARASTKSLPTDAPAARARLDATGRNDECPCGSGKKYKKCHLQADESAASPPPAPPDPMDFVNEAWRLFEQRRPGAAEKQFRRALELKPGMVEAQVGVGMSRLSAGDSNAARTELAVVVTAGEAAAQKLATEGARDGFTRPETQPYVRACHALGCLAYDEKRFADALEDLTRVYKIDHGPVGTEARLIAGKCLLMLDRPAEAVTVLEGFAKTDASWSRARMGLTVARLRAGDRPGATAALGEALAANPHFAKGILKQLRKRVETLMGAAPGSVEEAVIYAETYGDVWTDEAKAFLAESAVAPEASAGG